MSVLPFKQTTGKNAPSEIIAEYGSFEQMIKQAQQYARDLLHSCDESDVPMEVAVRALEDYGDVLPAAYRAAVLREVERLVEDYRY
jgi:hypothetical protein